MAKLEPVTHRLARPPQHTLFAFIATTLLFLAVSYWILAPPTRTTRRIRRVSSRLYARIASWVPVPAGLQAPADLIIAARSFSQYYSVQQYWLGRKRLAYARMPARQQKFSDKLDWRGTLRQAEDAVEVNSLVTDELAALAYDQARREGIPVGLRSRFRREDGRVVETLKHFVRDWSADGQSERDVLFPPILAVLAEEFQDPEARRKKTVLLPGCGLGRLAYEIACQGFSTEANDFSHFMNVASQLVFKSARIANQFEVAPHVHSFSHHRTADNMLRTSSFPDVVPRRDVDLKFSPGDFLKLYRREATHNAVVTLFFIDTAANLVDYFETLYRLLKAGGIWINLGPLLYYGNPAMELPLDDVLRLAKLVGFEIEQQREVKAAKYTADERGMYTFAYDCAFWIARKPESSALREA